MARDATPRTLEQLHRRPTSYEVVASCSNGQVVSLGFTERRTKRGLLEVARQNNQAVLEMLGLWDGDATYDTKSGWRFGPARVRFSGRTERDVRVAMDKSASDSWLSALVS